MESPNVRFFLSPSLTPLGRPFVDRLGWRDLSPRVLGRFNMPPTEGSATANPNEPDRGIKPAPSDAVFVPSSAPKATLLAVPNSSRDSAAR